MRKEQLQELYEKIKDKGMPFYPSEVWRQAFDYYNSFPPNKHLGMGCQPCFPKVKNFIAAKLGLIPMPPLKKHSFGSPRYPQNRISAEVQKKYGGPRHRINVTSYKQLEVPPTLREPVRQKRKTWFEYLYSIFKKKK